MHRFLSGDGFDKYKESQKIEKLSDISEAYKASIATDAKDKIEAYTASEYGNGETISNLAIAGEYLLLAKSPSSNDSKNLKYIVVYSATLSTTTTNKYNYFEPTTIYFPVEYDGIVKLSDTDFITSYVSGIKGKTNYVWTYSTKGYLEGTKMFSELVTANRTDYTYEVSDGLKAFGQ